MLPPELIRARKRKGTIRLMYASEDKLSLAKTLVSVYEEHVERTRGQLKEALNNCEELGFNYKLVRGLSAVLEERCVFQSRAVVDPLEARRAIFEEAARSVVTTEEDRRRVLSIVGLRMSASASDLDQSLYADLMDEQIQVNFETITPSDLLKEYNFALTLALLAHAGQLELTYRGSARELEEIGGRVGRCDIQKSGSTSKMVVEWRPTKRIGYKAAHLENLLTRLIAKKGWMLAADVRYPLRSKGTYRFEISGELEGKLIKPTPILQEPLVKKQSEHGLPTRSNDEIIVISEMASQLGVMESEIRRRFKEGGGGYLNLGGVLITKEKLEEVEQALSDAPDMRLVTVRGVLRNLGCRNPLPLLESLGYAVDWAEDRSRSTVYRLRKGSAHETPPRNP